MTEITEKNLKTAPHNIDAEQNIIGALLINNGNLNKIADFLSPGHFYLPIHQKIFEVIIKMYEKGMVASPITIYQYITKEFVDHDVDIKAYLIKLVSNSMTIINIESLAKEVHDAAIRREIIEVCNTTASNAYEQTVELSSLDLVEQLESELFHITSSKDTRDNMLSLNVSISNALAKIESIRKGEVNINGASTGFPELDSILGGGLQDSDLIILAARPSMGKTALALNIAINAAESLDKHKKSVCFFSMEMSSDQIATRTLSMESNIEASRIRNANISPEEFIKLSTAVPKIGNLPFLIDDTAVLSISALRTKVRRLKRQHDLGLVVVDYLQLMHGSKNYDSQRVLEIGEISKGLKAIAKEMNIPVIALSQLSRAVESRQDKKPLLSDLRESGSIEQDADVVMFIYRPEYYLAPQMPIGDAEKFIQWQVEMDAVKNKAEIIIAKHRNGATGMVTLHFDNTTTKFSAFEQSF